jgi:hypothetical protein
MMRRMILGDFFKLFFPPWVINLHLNGVANVVLQRLAPAT